MRGLLSVFVLVTMLLWSLPALAGGNVSLDGRVVGVLQYPNTNTICMSFVGKADKATYMVCDDVTSKDIIEKLFALGKKDADCHIEGTIAKKTKDGVYLAVTTVK